MKTGIDPKESQAFGLVVSGITGIVVMSVVWMLIASTLDFWYIGDVLGPAAGVFLGGLSAYNMFTKRRLEVPVFCVGVSLRFGAPSEKGRFYENGTHWVPPFWNILVVPGSEKNFILEMPGEKIDAQDGAVIFFGISEDERKVADVSGHKGKKNRVQYSIIDPIKRAKNPDALDAFKELYLEMARLFLGQASKAAGVRNEKTLFSDFLFLPMKNKPNDPEPAEHTVFRARIKETSFCAKKPDAGCPEELEKLFNDNSVIAIMEKAGDFKERAANWGIGNIVPFTPNVRENPELEEAAAKKSVATESMASLRIKSNEIKARAKELAEENKVNPDLAATLIAGLEGQKVDVRNETFSLSGLPEALQKIAGMVIDHFAKKTA